MKTGVKKVSGLYVLILQDRTFFFADTTVNIDPTAEDLAEIALLSADTAKLFGIEPRVAMIAFSNFGSTSHPATNKVRDAVKLVKQRRPGLECDGEMQADTAVLPEFLKENYPWTDLKGPANVLVFPELQSANAAYKLVWRLAKADAIGPILMGMSKPAHVLQRGGLAHGGDFRQGDENHMGHRRILQPHQPVREGAEFTLGILELLLSLDLRGDIRGNPLPIGRAFGAGV